MKNELKESIYQHHIDYCNEIIKIEKNYISYFNDFYKIIKTKDSIKAKKHLENWNNEINSMINKTNEFGSFKGDSILITIQVNLFKNVQKIINEYYLKHVEIYINDLENWDKIDNEAKDEIEKFYNDFNHSNKEQYNKYNTEKNYYLYLDIKYKEGGIFRYDPNYDPLLEPINGVSLYDHYTVLIKEKQGIKLNRLINALGIDKDKWDEADLIWNKREKQFFIKTKKSFHIQYLHMAHEHPILGHINNEKDNNIKNPYLKKITKNEKYFYKIFAEKEAAIMIGKDGDEYILEKYGINQQEFKDASLDWNMKDDNVEETADKLFDQVMKYYKKFLKEKE